MAKAPPPHGHKEARDVTERDIVLARAMWRDGDNTLAIAEVLGVDESEIYNRLGVIKS